MLKNLLTHYPNSQYSEHPALLDPSGHYDWFYSDEQVGFVGIKKDQLDDKERHLLSSLFHRYVAPIVEGRSEAWYRFLYHDGQAPAIQATKRHRVIQLQCYGEDPDQRDLEQAIRGFLSEDVYILWENAKRAIVIEAESSLLAKEEDFTSLSEVLENDLYIRVTFYIGKFLEVTSHFKQLFLQDCHFFAQSLDILSKERIFYFEKIFPAVLVKHLAAPMREALHLQLLVSLDGDEETLQSVKVYLENNSNASVTSKKLYIHRNTLQYRLDKFTEKTGVNLKDFSSAITLYLASLLDPNGK